MKKSWLAGYSVCFRGEKIPEIKTDLPWTARTFTDEKMLKELTYNLESIDPFRVILSVKVRVVRGKTLVLYLSVRESLCRPWRKYFKLCCIARNPAYAPRTLTDPHEQKMSCSSVCGRS